MRDKAEDKTRMERAIDEAVVFLPKNFVPRHVHSRRCYRVLKHILYPDEYTVIEAKQSLLKSIAPMRVVATNQRIIVVKPSFSQLWTGRNILSPTKYESIKYDNVSNITLYAGTVFSSIHIHLITGSELGEGSVEGLKTEDAKAIFIFLEKMMEALRKQDGNAGTSMERLRNSMIGGNRIDLGMAKDMARHRDSKLIWLGIEPATYISEKLGIGIGHIRKMDVSRLASIGSEDTKALDGSIFVCYNDFFAMKISEYLKRGFNIDTYVLAFGSEYQHVDNSQFQSVEGNMLR